MTQPLLLAVPNISEGRDPTRVADVAGDDLTLLDIDSDADHNRTVLTYRGAPDDIERACIGLLGRAVRLLDITKHIGAHPRFGVVDVLPIVPYNASRHEAERVADGVARRSPIPVFRYTDDLPQVRRRLRQPHNAHPTAGVVCVGVRGPLIAFNVNLRTTTDQARRIVRSVRELPGVRALAFELPSRNLVQVSMNLVEPRKTGPAAAFNRVVELTTDIEDAEIVGLIPERYTSELVGIPLRRPARTIESR